MKQIVIGTAGHIDHGKTTLITAITGIDCDRLKEEKERGITTELGFAHYKFGEDLLVGIVDVPGHEKFVRHMVAGAWGIDMVLLVVAADEGVMPQTREHLDICELLGLKRGIVAITKTDLVDEDMIELVKEDIEDFLAGRSLEGAPVIPVSSTTGENIPLLRDLIEGAAREIDERSREGIFRLPVDRVFTLKGFGTIVTGTCISGLLKVGDEIEIYPLGKLARVRNIQAYHEDVGEAIAGQRVALNIQGIEKNDIERGVVIGKPGTLFLAQRVDAMLKYLPLPLKPIKNNSVLRFHIATMQEEARLVLLDSDIIEPGEERFVQFVFSQPIVVLPGDGYILRGPYAIQTIGGGKILDVLPGRHKRQSEGLGSIYALLTHGSDTDKVEYHLLKAGHGGLKKELLGILLGKEEKKVDHTIQTLQDSKKALTVGKIIVHMEKFTEYKKILLKLINDYYAKNPLKVGISREELRMKLPQVEQQIFLAALEECIREGVVITEKDKVIVKGTKGAQGEDIERLKEMILKRLYQYGFTPPGLKELSGEIKKNEQHLKDILEGLVFDGKVVKIKGDMYFHREIIEDLKKTVVDFLMKKKEMTPSDLKSILNLSRKYMIPLLEYLDEIKLTIRVGDKRVL
ncbi:MAG TPA: selenocysteine-specific translation elongation factor, partial [Syntrophorhabdaceae bacterium]|nr:selenocysteine-specific translation elongation factor [Syntrophorhabdaceae bacterium]